MVRMEKIKETLELNDVINQMDLIDIYRIFHPNAKEHTFFSVAHGTFYEIDQTLRQETSQTIQENQNTLCILSAYHILKLNINNRK